MEIIRTKISKSNWRHETESVHHTKTVTFLKVETRGNFQWFQISIWLALSYCYWLSLYKTLWPQWKLSFCTGSQVTDLYLTITRCLVLKILCNRRRVLFCYRYLIFSLRYDSKPRDVFHKLQTKWRNSNHCVGTIHSRNSLINGRLVCC